MSVTAILVLCTQALLIQSAVSQCINRGISGGLIGPLPNRGWGYDGLGYDGVAWNRGLGCTGLDFTPTSGGGLPVTSSSAIAPTGLSIVSENAFEGVLAAAGEIPFIGTVAVDGVVPTGGSGAVNYGCGNGVTAMVSEGLGPAFGPGFAGIPAIAPGLLPPAEFGCGRGYLY